MSYTRAISTALVAAALALGTSTAAMAAGAGDGEATPAAAEAETVDLNVQFAQVRDVYIEAMVDVQEAAEALGAAVADDDDAATEAAETVLAALRVAFIEMEPLYTAAEMERFAAGLLEVADLIADCEGAQNVEELTYVLSGLNTEATDRATNAARVNLSEKGELVEELEAVVAGWTELGFIDVPVTPATTPVTTAPVAAAAAPVTATPAFTG